MTEQPKSKKQLRAEQAAQKAEAAARQLCMRRRPQRIVDYTKSKEA